MKKLILVLCMIFTAADLKAEIFGSADTVKPGDYMFGVEPQVTVDPSDIMGYFHFGAGLLDRMDLGVKLGVGTAATYFGGELQYEFLKCKILDFALSVGTHYQSAGFLDINPIFTHRFQDFSLSTGPDLDWKLSKGTYLSMSWFVGTSIPIRKNADLLFDAGVKIRGNDNWISGGIAAYF